MREKEYSVVGIIVSDVFLVCVMVRVFIDLARQECLYLKE